MFARDRLKKAVIVGPSAERYKGGIAQFTSYLALRLSRYCSTGFFSWEKLYPRFLSCRDSTDRQSCFPTPGIGADFVLSYRDPASWKRCAALITESDPELIILTWAHPVQALADLSMLKFLRKNSRAKIFYICHDVFPPEDFPGAQFLTRLCLEQADKIIVHSKAAAAEAARLLKGTADVETLFLPLHDFFAPREKRIVQKRGNELLFFGHIREYKGIDVLLEAMPVVLRKHPEARLTVAGEVFGDPRPWRKTSYPQQLRNIIRRNRLERSVNLVLRYIPNEEVSSFFTKSSIVVFPYRRVSQSGSLTVAYSYGKPVVASAVGGIPDVVVPGKSGLLVSPDDPSALASAINELIERPIAEEDVTKVAAELSWERYLDSFVQTSWVSNKRMAAAV